MGSVSMNQKYTYGKGALSRVKQELLSKGLDVKLI